LFKKQFSWALAIGATLVIAACSEKTEAGRGCPLLCPQTAITLADTTIEASIVADTTVTGLPPIGNETFTMLSLHGDTLDTRVMVRYDTIQQTYSINSIDSTIVKIDTAELVAPLVFDTLHKPTVPLTIEAYNVDTTATDTVASILAPLFRPSRLIGSKTFLPDSLSDTLRIPISTDTVLDRVKNGTRLRIGLRVVSSKSVDLRFGTSQSGLPISLRIKASADTAAVPVIVSPLSATPADQSFIAGPLADFTLVVKGGTGNIPGILGVGGVPSRRVFMRFDVPAKIVDSTTVVRASLLLTQVPNRRLSPNESVFVYPLAILAGPAITDVGSALGFAGPTGQFGMDSVSLAPADSGLRSFEIAGLVRTWKGQATTVSPRTLALRSGAEGSLPAEINFFSTQATNPALRPKLRITYVPQTSYGIP
jgi:hypothetical protein